MWLESIVRFAGNACPNRWAVAVFGRSLKVPGSPGGCPRKLASSFRKLHAAFQAGQANEERAGEFSGSNFQLLGNSLTALQYCQQFPRRGFNATLISIWSPVLKAVKRGVRASAKFPHAFLAYRIFESRLIGPVVSCEAVFFEGFRHRIPMAKCCPWPGKRHILPETAASNSREDVPLSGILLLKCCGLQW